MVFLLPSSLEGDRGDGVSGPGPTEAFIGRLTLLARGAGLDAERLADEVTDHLAEAAARHRLAGLEPAEAERRAIEEFGAAETLVFEVAAHEKGAVMTSTKRVVGMLAMLAATATLAFVHIVPSQSVSGTAWTWIAGGAVVVMALAGAMLVATSRARFRFRAPVWWMVALGATAAIGGLAAWEGGRIDVWSIHVRVPDRAYLAAIAALALLILLANRALGRRDGAGLGLILAGTASLLLTGAWSGDWRPLGAIGEGRGNMGIELILVGWVLVGVSWLTSAGAAEVRSSVGRRLIRWVAGCRPPRRPWWKRSQGRTPNLRRVLAERIADGVHRVLKGYVNAYVIEADEGLILVDTGLPRKAGRIAESLRHMGSTVKEIRHILITHHHLDHTGSLAALCREVDATVYCSPVDAPIVRGERMPPPLNRAKLSARVLGPAIERIGPKRAEPHAVDHALADGETLPIAGGLEVIATPGHTAGHVSFLLDREGGVLVAGDAASAIGQKAGPPVGAVLGMATEDLDEAVRSFHKLVGFDFEVALTGHGSPVRRGASELFRRNLPRFPRRPGNPSGAPR
jgi:glyoxylase-like metal-dependent hydrolase (beta-lactamase superfamily II)